MRVVLAALFVGLLALTSCGGATLGSPSLNSINDLEAAIRTPIQSQQQVQSQQQAAPQTDTRSASISVPEMLDRHNATRSQRGLGSLRFNARLAEAARIQAQYCADRGSLTHTGAGGSNIGQRASGTGYVWTLIGENLAMSTRPDRIYDLWLDSSGHLRNITDSRFTEVGLAVVQSGHAEYWCAVFGRP